MKILLHSKLAKQDYLFMRSGTGYLYVDINGDVSHISGAGYNNGETRMLYKGDDFNTFSNICKAWLKTYIKRVNNSDLGDVCVIDQNLTLI